MTNTTIVRFSKSEEEERRKKEEKNDILGMTVCTVPDVDIQNQRLEQTY